MILKNTKNLSKSVLKNNRYPYYTWIRGSMKTYECVARSGKTGKEIVIVVRAVDASQAKMNALVQARQQFGSSGGDE